MRIILSAPPWVATGMLLPHLAKAAFLAISVLVAGDSDFALAAPPFALPSGSLMQASSARLCLHLSLAMQACQIYNASIFEVADELSYVMHRIAPLKYLLLFASTASLLLIPHHLRAP
jgi:hypothetical protein